MVFWQGKRKEKMRDHIKPINESRKEFAIIQLDKLGIELTDEDDAEINFEWKGKTVKFFPYTGWHTGKSIKDGRGLQNLLKQLK